MKKKILGIGIGLFVTVILLIIGFATLLLTGIIGIRPLITSEFFITDKGNDCSKIEPPTHYKSGDNQAKHLGENGMPRKALWTSIGGTHPSYSDYYGTCNAHNFQIPIRFGYGGIQ